jgi:hypothetical protein
MNRGGTGIRSTYLGGGAAAEGRAERGRGRSEERAGLAAAGDGQRHGCKRDFARV